MWFHTLAALTALLPTTVVAQTVCQAAVDIVFIVDDSGSVGAANYYKAIDFMKGVISRFTVGAGANDAQVAMIRFNTVPYLGFSLNEHTTNADVLNGMSSVKYDGGGTCTGYATKMATDEVLCSTCPGRARAAPSIAIFLTDGNPGYLSTCVNKNTPNFMDRIAEIIRLKGIVNRIIPVGIGSGVSPDFLTSLSKDMPGAQPYITANYNDMGAIMDDLAAVACPSLPPTKMPTGVPTTNPSLAPTFFPSSSPTYNCAACTPVQQAQCDMGASRPGTCGFTDTTCNTHKCGCGQGMACSDAACGTCTAAPTLAPTSFPTSSPTFPPTFAPTSAPSPPTTSPTYWDLFNTGTDDKADAVVGTTVGIAAAGLGVLAIIAIVLGVIAAIVLLAMIAGGVGIFAARKKLFALDWTVDEKNMEKGNAISVGNQIEMTEKTANGMLSNGEITPEQFAEMGFEPPADERLPSYTSSHVFSGDRPPLAALNTLSSI